MTSKKKTSVKPRIVETRFSKRQLMELPRQERELFLRVGLVLNDLLLFQRLWAAFMYREPRTPLAKQAQAVHAAALLLIIGGKVFEACDIFEKRFLSSHVGRRYLSRFSRSHKDTVRQLRKRLGANALLAKIRNRFAFHYHKDDLTPFVERMVPDHVFRASRTATLCTLTPRSRFYSLCRRLSERVRQRQPSKKSKTSWVTQFKRCTSGARVFKWKRSRRWLVQTRGCTRMRSLSTSIARKTK